MTPDVHLGIDVGGTASRWVACDEAGVEIARGKAPGATGHLFNPVELARLRATLTAIAKGVGASGLLAKSLTAGLTGYGAAVRDDLEALLAEIFGTERSAIIVTDDIVLAYLANFAPGEGHLVSAGTGSIGLHIGAGFQSFVRVGGRGILIDDAGSGSWIALRALDQLYRHLDHAGSPDTGSSLARQLFAAIGGTGWDDVRQFVYGGDRGRIGTLALAVARAAEEGDGIALTVLRRAGNELGQLGLALVARAGERPIGFVGGVLGLHPLIAQGIRQSLAGRAVLMLEADAALAAARLQATGDRRWREALALRSTIG